MNEKEQKETKAEEERIRENGQVTLEENGKRIHLLSIIGEIEGHDNLSGSTKTTKYEHILPELAKVESDEKIGGVLILVSTPCVLRRTSRSTRDPCAASWRTRII